jgi:hypothetical protein
MAENLRQFEHQVCDVREILESARVNPLFDSERRANYLHFSSMLKSGPNP